MHFVGMLQAPGVASEVSKHSGLRPWAQPAQRERLRWREAHLGLHYHGCSHPSHVGDWSRGEWDPVWHSVRHNFDVSVCIFVYFTLWGGDKWLQHGRTDYSTL